MPNAGWRVPLHGLHIQASRASLGIAFPVTRSPHSHAVCSVRALARAKDAPHHRVDAGLTRRAIGTISDARIVHQHVEPTVVSRSRRKRHQKLAVHAAMEPDRLAKGTAPQHFDKGQSRPGGEFPHACISRSRLHHHGSVPSFACENVPVGPSGPSSARRTASRAPSSTVSVPA